MPIWSVHIRRFGKDFRTNINNHTEPKQTGKTHYRVNHRQTKERDRQRPALPLDKAGCVLMSKKGRVHALDDEEVISKGDVRTHYIYKPYSRSVPKSFKCACHLIDHTRQTKILLFHFLMPNLYCSASNELEITTVK